MIVLAVECSGLDCAAVTPTAASARPARPSTARYLSRGLTCMLFPPGGRFVRRSLSHADGRVVEPVDHLVDITAEVHLGVEEVGELPVQKGRPGRLEHDLAVERSPARV